MGSVMVMGLVPFLAGVSRPRESGTYRRSCCWVVLGLPAALGDAGELAAVGHLAHADPAQAELAVHRVGPAATLAARVATHRELRLGSSLVLEGSLRHGQISLNGKPRSLRKARPSSSVSAVVTTVMSIPRTRSILSWSISWNTDCSTRPKV